MQHLTHLVAWKNRLGHVVLPRKLIIGAGILLFLTAMALASEQEIDSKATGKNLSLDIYLYNTGNALVAGYIDSIDDLPILKPAYYTPNDTSKYTFDHQLYAWTDTLTSKQGKTWKLMFSSLGFYNDYRIVFHLPGNLMLGRINSSKGLNYLVLASNDSLTVDVHGYSVLDPMVSVEYQQPLEEQPPKEISVDSSSYNPLLIAGAVFALVVGLALVFVIKRRKERLQPTADELKEPTLMEPQIEIMPRKIEVSGEMKAIMETLTPRERSILEVLIKHGGRMTQLEIRYETDSPKSSIAMILNSLEKRKLITKKEFGRTNIVELSEWLLSRK